MGTTRKTEEPARRLQAWFMELLQLCDGTVFAVTSAPERRKVAYLWVLTRNAKLVVNSDLDNEGGLYAPLCLMLASACRRLAIESNEDNWRVAIENVLNLCPQMSEARDTLGIPLGTPASIFKNQLDEALINAGVTDRHTILDDENRQLALGFAVNWGFRFLIAYALECGARKLPERGAETRDLRWIREQLSALLPAA